MTVYNSSLKKKKNQQLGCCYIVVISDQRQEDTVYGYIQCKKETVEHTQKR